MKKNIQIKFQHIVEVTDGEDRFNTYCEEQLTIIPSRKGIKKAIKKGELRLNGEVVEGGRWLKENDAITLVDLDLTPPKTYHKKLTIVYGNEGGYTPGDAYDFYYDEDYIVDEWVYRKGNASAPSMITTFSDYQDFGGLNIATSHSDKEGNFKLYFTDIKVVK